MKIHNKATSISWMSPDDADSLPKHEMAEAFPPLDEDTYAALKTSMDRQGYNASHPLVFQEDEVGGNHKLIDGVHRLKAALDAGVKQVPVAVVALTDPEVRDYVMAANATRRHMKKSEIAETVRKLAKLGTPVKAIAKSTGMSRQRVEELTVNERAGWKAAVGQKATDMKKEGKTVKQISKATGMSVGKVSNMFNSANNGKNEQPPKAAVQPAVTSTIQKPTDSTTAKSTPTVKSLAKRLFDDVVEPELRKVDAGEAQEHANKLIEKLTKELWLVLTNHINRASPSKD